MVRRLWPLLGLLGPAFLAPLWPSRTSHVARRAEEQEPARPDLPNTTETMCRQAAQAVMRAYSRLAHIFQPRTLA